MLRVQFDLFRRTVELDIELLEESFLPEDAVEKALGPGGVQWVWPDHAGAEGHSTAHPPAARIDLDFMEVAGRFSVPHTVEDHLRPALEVNPKDLCHLRMEHAHVRSRIQKRHVTGRLAPVADLDRDDGTEGSVFSTLRCLGSELDVGELQCLKDVCT